MGTESKPPIPKWLEDLQQRSWEPEILLSGIVLYGMFKVPALLDWFLTFFRQNIFGNTQDIDNLVALFKMGIYWLITGLILHLICRGIWIGMVGLSYTFPKGIRMDRISYREKFQNKVEKTSSYEEIVIRLEKISSALFSVSFMLFMSLIGGYLFFFLLVVIPFIVAFVYFDMRFSGSGFDVFQYWVLLILSIGILGLVDFVSLGYFRRFKWFAKIYWPLHRLISALTLSRFYRPIYYGLVTNFNKWVVFAFLLIFSFSSIFGAGRITDTLYPGDGYSRLTYWSRSLGYSAFSGYYDDQNVEVYSERAHIPSDIVNGDVLRLFVVGHITYEENMTEHTPIDSLEKLYPDTSQTALHLMVVSEFFEVTLDDEPVSDLDWLFHYKSTLDQRGFLTYIDISDLPEGLHWIDVKGPEHMYNFPFAVIPFYRDVLVQNPSVREAAEEEKSVDFQPKPFGIRD